MKTEENAKNKAEEDSCLNLVISDFEVAMSTVELSALNVARVTRGMADKMVILDDETIISLVGDKQGSADIESMMLVYRSLLSAQVNTIVKEVNRLVGSWSEFMATIPPMIDSIK
jgi:hypothetical protein